MNEVNTMKKSLMLACLPLLLCTPVHAEDLVVAQRDKAFDRESVTIRAGQAIEFLNQDPYTHNIFTMTDPMFVDLGTFAQGESRSMTFDQAGSFVVECAIHPEMRLEVQVTQ